MLRSYFIEGRFLGSIDESALNERGDNYFWFCLKCGEVYARAPVTNPRASEQIWDARWGCCERCTPPEFIENWVPGSIWSIEYYQNRNNFLPGEVLKRELLLTIKQLEKEMQSDVDKRAKAEIKKAGNGY